LEASLRWIAWLLAAIIINAAPAAGEIVIGIAGPFTGQNSTLGSQLRVGVDAAVAAVNADGGINGEKLLVTAIDDGCDTRKAVDAARQFVTQDVRLVVGHYCAGASSAAALIYKDAGVLMITPSASHPALTDKGNWNVFRTTGRDDAPFALAARRIQSTPGAPKTAVVSSNSLQFQALVQPASTILPNALGITVKLGSFNSTTTAQELMDNAVERVIVGLPSAEASALVSSLIYAGFQGAVYGGEQFLTDDFASNASEVQYEMYAAFPEDPMTAPAASRAAASLVLSGFTPDGATLPAYAAVQVFVEGAKARSVNDGVAISEWLRAGNSINTVLGRISFDAKGDLARQPFAWYRWLPSAKRFVTE
jgi:branched-chain amino acid transport system substrate-binding protein